jgi:hypothetical protein
LIVGWDRSDRFLDTLSPFIVEIIDIAHAILLVNEARIPQNIRHADNLVGWNQVIFLNVLQFDSKEYFVFIDIVIFGNAECKKLSGRLICGKNLAVRVAKKFRNFSFNSSDHIFYSFLLETSSYKLKIFHFLRHFLP